MVQSFSYHFQQASFHFMTTTIHCQEDVMVKTKGQDQQKGKSPSHIVSKTCSAPKNPLPQQQQQQQRRRRRRRRQQQQQQQQQERQQDEIVRQLIRDRAQYRLQRRWDEADRIKCTLEEDYDIELLDQADPMATTWIPRRRGAASKVVLEWHAASEASTPRPTVSDTGAILSSSDKQIPFIVNTVDTPYYRKRFHETMDYLEQWRRRQQQRQKQQQQQNGHSKSDCFRFQKCDLLDLQNHPSIGSKGILMEGWKTILIPSLLQQQSTKPLEEREEEEEEEQPPTPLHGVDGDGGGHRYEKDIEFVLIAEDDVRFPDSVTPTFLRNLCTRAFASHPDVLVLSLGHSWSTLQKTKGVNRHDHHHHHDAEADSNSSSSNKIVDDKLLLLNFLRHKPMGIHATTLLAMRYPSGVSAVQEALDTASRPQHLDQFLFHSTQHNIPLAVSDPPLAGWTEVEQSLTKSGTGYRRLGGGRLGHVPAIGDLPGIVQIQWIQRRVITKGEGPENKRMNVP